MRGQACELPNEQSKENLIDYFENIRLKYMKVSDAKKDGTIKRLQQTFQEDKDFLNFILTHFKI